MNNLKRVQMLTELLIEALNIIDGLNSLVQELEEEKRQLEVNLKYQGGEVDA